MAHVLSVFAQFDYPVCVGVYAESVSLAFRPAAFVSVSVLVEILAESVYLAIDEISDILVSRSPGITALAMQFPVNEISFLDISVGKDEASLPIVKTLPYLALILTAIKIDSLKGGTVIGGVE